MNFSRSPCSSTVFSSNCGDFSLSLFVPYPSLFLYGSLAAGFLTTITGSVYPLIWHQSSRTIFHYLLYNSSQYSGCIFRNCFTTRSCSRVRLTLLTFWTFDQLFVYLIGGLVRNSAFKRRNLPPVVLPSLLFQYISSSTTIYNLFVPWLPNATISLSLRLRNLKGQLLLCEFQRLFYYHVSHSQ